MISVLSGNTTAFAVKNRWVLCVVKMSQRVLVMHVLSVVSSLRTLPISDQFSFSKLINIDRLATNSNLLLVLDQLELLWRVFMEDLIKIRKRACSRSSINDRAPPRKHALLRRVAALQRTLLQVSLRVSTD